MASGPPSAAPAAAQDTNDEQPVQSNSRLKKGRNVYFLFANTQGLQGIAPCRKDETTYLLDCVFDLFPRSAQVLYRCVAVHGVQAAQMMEGLVTRAATAPSSMLSMSTRGACIQHAGPRLRQPKKIKPSTDRWDVMYQNQTREEQRVLMLPGEVWSAAHKWDGTQQVADCKIE
eukprot:6212766-Pleurochrysis_carterae.AAC.1